MKTDVGEESQIPEDSVEEFRGWGSLEHGDR